MMPDCREVVHALASDDLRSARWWKRFLIRLHLLMCAHCGTYARQLAILGNAARRLFSMAPAKDPRLGEIEKSLVTRLSARSGENRD